MRKFVRKIQTLSDQASKLQGIVEGAPGRIAEFREAIGMTTNELRSAVDVTSDELRQLRSDVEKGLTGLRVQDAGKLLESLREFNEAIPIFRQAGYEVGGTDIEISPVQRIIVHLDRVEDVSQNELQNIVIANTRHQVATAVLQALVRAEAMADQVDLDGLVYYRLEVTIGPVPEVRLCWCPEQVGAAAAGVEVRSAAGAAGEVEEELSSKVEPAQSDLLEDYADSTIFGPSSEAGEQEPLDVEAEPAPELVREDESDSPQPPPLPSESQPPPIPTGKTDWASASLERFKKMPSASKYSR